MPDGMLDPAWKVEILRQFRDRCRPARAFEILSGGGSEGEARAIKIGRVLLLGTISFRELQDRFKFEWANRHHR
jgi:hypothetical protein